MDQDIKDSFKVVKDRLTNPFIFSYIISWLIYNWQITIALFWYDANEIKLLGYNNLFDLIIHVHNSWKCYTFPFISATVLSFVTPFLKNFFKIVYAKFDRWGDEKILEFLKTAVIPYQNFYKLQLEQSEREKVLNATINSQSGFKRDYDSLELKYKELSEMMDQQNKVVGGLQEFRNSLFDVNYLNGYWTNSFKDLINKTLSWTEFVYIENGKYYVIDPISKMQIHKFDILNFSFDTDTKKIYFIKDRIEMKSAIQRGNTTYEDLIKYNPNFLEVKQNGNLEGRENYSTEITYIKTMPLTLKSN